jgi:alginate O-acetyltransferase complex protein AlgI
MLFNSYAFIFAFLPLTLVVYFSLCRARLAPAARVWLVVASLFYYSYADVRYLPLLIGSVVFNYAIGRSLWTMRNRGILALGIAVDLLLLGYFKYTNFFLDNLSLLGLHTGFHRLAMPLGISFFTFTQIAFLVDAYRGEGVRTGVVGYGLFVTIFTDIFAGPILRQKSMLPQLADGKRFAFNAENLARGLTLFSAGLFKKVVIADYLVKWVTPVFENASAANFAESWTGALAYTFQLYFDFSGYSEMAMGAALMFNLDIPLNFNSPYKSGSIIEFWRRWHMTLSFFLRDYLYIPLGGSRRGHFRKMLNLLITMFLGGLWHGAGWTFVLWGTLHGFYLVLNHTWRKLGFATTLEKFKSVSFMGWAATFAAVTAAWVFFRARTIADGFSMVSAMAGAKGLGMGFSLIQGERKEALLILAGALLFVRLAPNVHDLMRKFKPGWRWAVVTGTLLAMDILSLTRVSEFLYFQF